MRFKVVDKQKHPTSIPSLDGFELNQPSLPLCLSLNSHLTSKNLLLV